MNKSILGIILIVIGAALLAYGYITYQSRDTVLEVGPIKATADRTHHVSVPPVIGWVLVGAGVCVVIFGSRSKT